MRALSDGERAILAQDGPEDEFLHDTYSVNEVRAMLRHASAGRGGQAKMARKLDVSEVFISNILSGKKNPTSRIARHFGLRPQRQIVFVPLGTDGG